MGLCSYDGLMLQSGDYPCCLQARESPLLRSQCRISCSCMHAIPSAISMAVRRMMSNAGSLLVLGLSPGPRRFKKIPFAIALCRGVHCQHPILLALLIA